MSPSSVAIRALLAKIPGAFATSGPENLLRCVACPHDLLDHRILVTPAWLKGLEEGEACGVVRHYCPLCPCGGPLSLGQYGPDCDQPTDGSE